MIDLACKLPETCRDCGRLTYPTQGFCAHCLSENVTAISVPFYGTVLAQTTLHHSFNPAISNQLPLTLCSIEIQAGVVVFTLAQEAGLRAGGRVLVDEGTWPFGKRLTAKRAGNDAK